MRLMLKWLNHRLSLINLHLGAWKLLVINSWFTQCTCHTFSHIKILIHAKTNRDMNMMLTLLCISCFVYNVNKVHNGRSRYINITGLWLYIHCMNMNYLFLLVSYNIIKSGILLALLVHMHEHIKIQVRYTSVMPKHILERKHKIFKPLNRLNKAKGLIFLILKILF